MMMMLNRRRGEMVRRRHHRHSTQRVLLASSFGLEYSAQLLSELRTSMLSPHKYYELCKVPRLKFLVIRRYMLAAVLYMRAFDELRRLEIFFKEEDRHGCTVVQHVGNVLPRLYLLCTVGSVYIKSKEAPAKDILKDLVKMCCSVQHPIRGLFLRSYLAQVSRDKLSDIGSDYEGEDDTVVDDVEFVLQNFTGMNKLSVQMQLEVFGNLLKFLFKIMLNFPLVRLIWGLLLGFLTCRDLKGRKRNFKRNGMNCVVL